MGPNAIGAPRGSDDLMTSTTTATILPAVDADRRSVTFTGWLWIIAIGVLFLALHWSFVNRMIHIATKAPGGKKAWDLLVHIVMNPWNADWSHTLIVPLISLYFVVRSGSRLVVTPRRVFPMGLGIFFLGLLSFFWWVHPGRNDMLQGFSMVFALFGLVLFLVGPAMMRILWFPIAYLVFFVKISDRFWNLIAWKLQGIAAEAATIVLKFLSLIINFDVSKSGNKIEVGYAQGGAYLTSALAVEEACSGLRMLMAFVALGVAMAYLTDRMWWQRIVMVALTVPIAVAVNVGRVVTLGLLSMVDDQMIKGDFHTFIGMLMLIPAAGLFWLVGWILDKMVIVEESGRSIRPSAHIDKTVAGKVADCDGGDKRQKTLDVVKGLGAGAILSGLVGLNYYVLLLVWLQPYRQDMSQWTANVCLGASVLALVVAAFLIWRLVQPSGSSTAESSSANAKKVSGMPGRPATIALGIGAGILMTALTGFGAVNKINGVVLLKHPIELRNPLYRLRGDFGNWKWVGEDPELPPEQLEVLGTEEYISYDFLDRNAKPGSPAFQVKLHVTYYTGNPDTVPHVPERCIIGGGATGVGQSYPTLNLEGPQYREVPRGFDVGSIVLGQDVFMPDLQINATLFQYHWPENPDRTISVIYFFIANHKFLASPDLVRLHGFDPRDQYSYYCKVEVGLGNIPDPEVAVQRASDFLSKLLPEVMGCLPDLTQLQKDSVPSPELDLTTRRPNSSRRS